MKLNIFIISALVILPINAAKAVTADERAVEACKKSSNTFVQVADCLPRAHVAYKMIDAFDTIYPAEAAPLKDRCIELNKNDISGAGTCISVAVKKAIELKSSLPENADVGDPIFNAVSNKDGYEKLQNVINAARDDFPEVSIWGGRRYYQYK